MKNIINLILSFLLLIMLSAVVNSSDSIYRARFVNQYDMNVNMPQSDNVIINDNYVVTIKHNNEWQEDEHYHEDGEECDHELLNATQLTNPEEYLIHLRKEQEEYYTRINQQVIDSLNLNYENVTYSKFAPYIQIVFDTFQNYVNCDLSLENLLQNEKIDTIYVNNGFELVDDEVAVRNNNFVGTYNYQQALNDVGVDANRFSGDGVRIGVMETGSPEDLFGLDETQVVIRDESGSPANITRHSAVVSNIIAGDFGISENSRIYFSPLGTNPNNSLYGALNWQVSYPQSVHLINISYGAAGGNYTSVSELFDYISVKSKVLFVVASGNNGPSANIFSTGFNTISVGSVDVDGDISFFSNAGVTGNLINRTNKPTLVAPGGRLFNVGNIPNRYLENPLAPMTNLNDGQSGTSFSTPIVTGIAALLMEEYNYLILQPWILHSILVAGVTTVSGQTTVYDNLAGYGMVNYQNSRDICYNNNFLSVYKSTYASPNSSIYYGGYLSIPSGSTVTVTGVIFMPAELVSNPNTNNNGTVRQSRYRISITQRINGNYVDLFTQGSNTNYFRFTYTNSTSTQQEYLIKVQLDGTFNSQSAEYGGISFVGTGIHRHWHRHLISSNALTHTLECNCGDSYAFSHYVDLNDGGGGYFDPKYCGLCGHVLDPRLPWPAY